MVVNLPIYVQEFFYFVTRLITLLGIIEVENSISVIFFKITFQLQHLLQYSSISNYAWGFTVDRRQLRNSKTYSNKANFPL